MLQDDPPQMLGPPLTLNWRKGKDMPIKMGTTVQSVVIRDAVYVGGGDAGNSHDSCTVMKLDLQRDEWTKLPQYSAVWFAITSLDNQLVLVGGRDPVTWKTSNQVAIFASRWTNPYPPMNTARHSSTAVCFNNHIIVAGGHDNKGKRTSSVEVLDLRSRRWYIAEMLPNPRTELKSPLIGNTLYLLGGRDHIGCPTKVVHMVDLNELIKKAVSQQAMPTLWQFVENMLFKHSAPLIVEGSLLAVGGWDGNPSSSIHLYQPDARRWVKVGDLPTARYSCTCSVLPSGEVIVAGGQTGVLNYSNTVDFLSISNGANAQCN